MSKLVIPFFVAATSLALILVKLGTKSGLPISFVANKLQFNLNAYTIAGILLYGLSFASYIYLLSRYDLGYIIPLTTALVYVLVFVASYFIFHEVFTVAKIIGIGLILSGLIFLNLNR